MFGNIKFVGSLGIHPFASPAWYDHSSASSAFHVLRNFSATRINCGINASLPLDPPLSFLVRDYLGFPELSQECLVTGTERRGGTGETCTATDARRAWIRSVVSAAYTPAVKVFRAVRRSYKGLKLNSGQMVSNAPGVHSPTITHRSKVESDDCLPQTVEICCGCVI
jgi:hypothetical protein